MAEDKDIRSTVDKLRKQREQQTKQEQAIIENIGEYQKALNSIAGSANGKLVFRTLIKALEVFTPKEGVDGVALIEVNTKRNFYLKMIRPHLHPEIKQELEY